MVLTAAGLATVQLRSGSLSDIIRHTTAIVMFDKETWRFINTFAPWLSALGTILAVVVSLYLARRSTRLDVRVFPALVNIFTPGQPGPHPEFFQVRAVNHGGRDVIINGVGWRLVGLARRNWLVLPSGNPYSAKTPAKLAFGEEASFLYPTDTYTKDAEPLLRRIYDSWFPRLTVRLLRVGVFSSTGQQFFVPGDKHIRQFLLKQASAVPGTTSGSKPI